MTFILTERLLHYFHFVLLGLVYLSYEWIKYLFSNKVDLGDHTGEIAIITGGHRGIGEWVSRDLLRAGMHLIMGCRRIEDGKRFEKEVREEGITSGKVTILQLDLNSFISIKSFAQNVLQETTQINLLINNAGMIPHEFKLTEDGFETSWQANYLGHFLLSHLLLPTLQTTVGSAKILNVASIAHIPARTVRYKDWNNREGFNGWVAYMRTKLAQIMFTYYLNDKLKSVDSKVKVVAVHPGMVHTAILEGTLFSYFSFWSYKSPKQGAVPVVYAALYGKGGEYISDNSPKRTSALSRDLEQQHNLFEESKRLLNISSFGNIF